MYLSSGGSEEAKKQGTDRSDKSYRTYKTYGFFAVCACVLALLSACMVGPNYVKPTAPVPATYKEIEGWKQAQPAEEMARGPWWEVFNDPDLNALEAQVNISNQNVAIAEANFRQAVALVQAARAGYFPTVTTAPSVTRSQRSGTLGTTTSAGGIPLTDYLLPVNAAWEVDVWGRIRRTVEASRASAQASAGDLESARLSAQAQLAQNYFQLRILDAEKKLLDETIVAYQKSLELTRNRYAAGVASRADVLLAETQLKTTQAQAIDVGVLRAQLEHSIALLIGRPPSGFSLPFAPFAGLPPSIPVSVPSELLERRPDIAAAEQRVAAANAEIGVAIAAYYPRLTLSAAGGFETTDLAKWFTWPSRFWSVGPELAETLFDGGSRRALTAQARAAYDANVGFYRQTVLTGFQQVEDNLAALRILDDEARVQDAAVRAALDTVTVTKNQYKAGTVNYLAVIVTQAAALTNQRTAVNILGQRMTAAVLLIRALGGGWHATQLPDASALAHSGGSR